MDRGGFMVHRPKDRVAVGHPSHERKMCGDLDSGDVSGNGKKWTTNILWGQRLGVPGVQLARPANQKKNDAVNLFIWRVRTAKLGQIRQGQPGCSSRQRANSEKLS